VLVLVCDSPTNRREDDSNISNGSNDTAKEATSGANKKDLFEAPGSCASKKGVACLCPSCQVWKDILS
jgi:hypothetical protein